MADVMDVEDLDLDKMVIATTSSYGVDPDQQKDFDRYLELLSAMDTLELRKESARLTMKKADLLLSDTPEQKMTPYEEAQAQAVEAALRAKSGNKRKRSLQPGMG